jgi:hypothetical protein
LLAADRFWVGLSGAANNWNNTANWSTTSGGTGGASVPGSADIAIFDGSGLGNCTINATVNVAGLTVQSGYTGTISQGSNAITAGATGAVFSGGTFTGGSASITINGAITISGTAFTATSGTMTLGGNFTFSSGSFAHNSGTVKYTNTCTISGSHIVNNLELANTNGSDNVYTVSSGNTVTVDKDLTYSGTRGIYVNTGTLDVKGNIALNATHFGGGTGTIKISGTGNQSLVGQTNAGGYCRLPNIIIDKSSGTLTLAAHIWVLRSWTYVQGTIDATTNNSKVVFYAGGGTISGSHALNNVTFSTCTYTISSGTVLTVLGEMKHDDSAVTLNTGTIDARGDITIAQGNGGGGTAEIRINGTGNQILSSPFTTNGGWLPNIRIEKTSGTLFLKNFLTATRDWIYVSGTVDVTTYSNWVRFSSFSKTISGSHTLKNVEFYAGQTNYTISSGTTLTVTGTLSFNGADYQNINTGTIDALGDITVIGNAFNTGTGGGTATINISGSGSQSFTGNTTGNTGRLCNVNINKPNGTLTLSNSITCGANWTYTQGTINAGSSTVCMSGTKTITGSHALNNVTFYGSGFDYTISSGTILTVNGTLAYEGAFWGRLYTGTIHAKGNINITNTGTNNNGTATIVINGTGTQTLTGSGVAGTGRLCNIEINKSSGTLTLNSIISCSGNWTYTQGTVNAGTNASTVAMCASATLTPAVSGTTNKMSFHHLQLFSGTCTLASECNASGNVTISSGAALTPGSNNIFLGGNWSNSGTYNAGTSTVTFNAGSSTQTITKSSGSETFYRLTVNKSTGIVQLNSSLIVSDALTLTKGAVTTTSTNLLTLNDNVTATGGSDSSYVSGPMKKIGNDVFTFPLGSTSLSSGNYHPLSITAPSVATDAYTAQYLASAQAYGTQLDYTLDGISACEYWTINRVTGTSNVYVTLGLNTTTCSIEDSDELRVGAWNGTKWMDFDNGGYTVTGNNISLKTGIAVNFPLNPLPILAAFKAPGYAVLAKKADGGYYRVFKNKLYFTIDGEYDLGTLSYKVFNEQRTSITLPVNTSVRKVDDNRYQLNVSSLTAGYYELVVTNEKNETLTLKFKK